MDKKRISGPDQSVRPFFPPSATSVIDVDSGERSDGRGAEEFRPLFLKSGVIENAVGSAYVESGRLKAICAVYGPRQSGRDNASQDSGSLMCDFKFAPFASPKRRSYKKDIQEHEFSLILQQALAPALFLERYPKSRIDVFVTILENDGSHAALAAAITCASLALTDAGFEMRDQVVACSACIIGDSTFLDCNSEEEALSVGGVLLAHMPSINEVTTIVQTGEIEGAEVTQIVDLATDACAQLVDALRLYHIQNSSNE